MNKLFYCCAALVTVFSMEAAPAEDNVLCGLEPSEGCSDEEAEQIDEDFGRQITLFYSEVHSNKEKFVEAFLNSECPAACEALGYSGGHVWQKLCENECSDFKSQVQDAEQAKEFYGTGPGCGCGAGRSQQGDGGEGTGTCSQSSDGGDVDEGANEGGDEVGNEVGDEVGDQGFKVDL